MVRRPREEPLEEPDEGLKPDEPTEAHLPAVVPIEAQALPAIQTALPPGWEGLSDDAAEFVRAAKSKATKKAWRSDWGTFEAWCRQEGLVPVPTTPAMLANYVAWLAKTPWTTPGGEQRQRRPSTIQRAVASISKINKVLGHPSPWTSEQVTDALEGVFRTLGAKRDRKDPLLPDDLRRLCSSLPKGVRGVRDRAILLLGFAMAQRRSNVAALLVGDLAFEEQGVAVTIQWSKTDQRGEGAVIPVFLEEDESICPVRALRAWLEAGAVTSGPVFRRILGKTTVTPDGLSGEAVADVVKAACKRAGLDEARFAGHSLRSGFATEAARQGADASAIMRQTLHKRVEQVQEYVRLANPFDASSAKGILGGKKPPPAGDGPPQ